MNRLRMMFTNKWTRSLGLGLIVSLLWVILASSGLLTNLQWKLLDLNHQIHGEQAGLSDIVVVGIDDQSLAEIGRWPWPRSIHGELVHRLSEAGARLIAFDILFAEEEPSDIQLAEAMNQAGNVILASKFESVVEQGYSTHYLVRPTQLLREAALAEGFINFPIDNDSFIRRAHTFTEHQETRHLSFPAILALLQEAPLPTDREQLADTSYLITYAGGPRSFTTYSYYQILNKMIPQEWLKDKTILVGGIAPDLRDVFPTPFISEGLTPGVEIHANALATILSGQYIKPTPMVTGVALTVLTGLLAGTVVGVLAPLLSVILVITIGLGLLSLSYMLFASGHWLPVVAPLGALISGVFVVALVQYLGEEREKRRIRTIFGRFVSESVVQDILTTRDELALGGKRQRITILFADIRGFTPLSEQLPPEEVVGLLNEYFGSMTKIIFENGGMVDKFMGDCIMALFGTPVPLPNHEEVAVKTALAMRAELQRLQEKWSDLGKVSLQAGIGVNTGEVVVGNIGSDQRMEYTAIGDAVNLAARFESLTRQCPCEILVGEETYQAVANSVRAITLPQMQVKGKSQPIDVYGIEEWEETAQVG